MISDIFEEITSFLKIFSFSMIILLLISFINAKMFKIKIYKHQKCAILFNFSVLFVSGLSSFILSMKSDNEDIIFKQHSWLIPIGLIIYLLLGIAFSYAYSKIKWILHFNLISFSALLINFALVGFLINSIICVLITFIEWGHKQDEGNYIMIFFKIFINICRDENKFDLIFVICLIFLHSFILFLNNFFALSVLKNLYPECYFFTIPIRETFIEIIYLFHNRIFKGYFFEKDREDIKYHL